MPAKNSLRDKLEDDVLDLSLMQLYEVPVEEIVRKLAYQKMFQKHNAYEVLQIKDLGKACFTSKPRTAMKLFEKQAIIVL